jgi:regulator of replication initiation timing
MKMKNQYEIKQSYIISLENEQLRNRIMELTKQFNEIKKKYESFERERVASNERENSVIQE